MPENVCTVTLIFPGWTGWPFIVIGLAALGLAIWRLFFNASPGTFSGGWRATVGNIFPVILLLTGVVGSLVGLLVIIASTYQPFAFWVGEHLPSLIDQADLPVHVEMNDRPLGDQVSELPTGGLYTVLLASDARAVRVRGQFHARCSGSLIIQICRHEHQALSCDTDTQNKIIRVCTRGNDAPCKGRSL